MFKWYQNDNIVQEVDVLSTALSFCFGGKKFSTYLYCCKLTDELTAIGEKHYQREIVLLVSALALVWRRCLHVR